MKVTLAVILIILCVVVGFFADWFCSDDNSRGKEEGE